MEIKVIKNDKEYEEALKLVTELMDKNPLANTPDAEKLELLATLVQNYEEEVYGENLPDPIEALLFRMEQQNLSPDDLVQYIGSRSKVSEVLSRKRQLSLNMIKALNTGLGIPAKVLLNQRGADIELSKYDMFPIKEMLKRGYLGVVESSNIELLKKRVEDFFGIVSSSEDIFALLSRTYYVRSPKPMNPHYLFTWATQVIRKAKKVENVGLFRLEKITHDFMRSIIDLSDEDDGIAKAINLLKKNGIVVIVEPHFPYTYLDGAAIIIKDFNPIIGLTIRQDRLDNFWFTLIHELSHIVLHKNSGVSLFYDNVESIDMNDKREMEADKLAIETMVPEKCWRKSPASILPSLNEAIKLAKELSIHPAIIAGKMRYENKFYSYLNSVIGQDEVRKKFPNILWKNKD